MQNTFSEHCVHGLFEKEFLGRKIPRLKIGSRFDSEIPRNHTYQAWQKPTFFWIKSMPPVKIGIFREKNQHKLVVIKINRKSFYRYLSIEKILFNLTIRFIQNKIRRLKNKLIFLLKTVFY